MITKVWSHFTVCMW